MRSHVTRHERKRHTLTPAKQAAGVDLLDLPTPDGWKAELTLVVDYNTEMVYLSARSQPSSYPAENRTHASLIAIPKF